MLVGNNVLKKSIHAVVIVFCPFVTVDHSNLLQVLIPPFNSSIYFPMFVLSVRSQNRLVIISL